MDNQIGREVSNLVEGGLVALKRLAIIAIVAVVIAISALIYAFIH
jgi:hypothetical protein